MQNENSEKSRGLLNIARILRRNMTRYEKHLWYDYLRHYPTKFYKQRILGNYIADFYCHKARLVIELDGEGHYSVSGKRHDKERTAVLEELGLAVLRFSNADVEENFEGVCRVIDNAVRARLKN